MFKSVNALINQILVIRVKVTCCDVHLTTRHETIPIKDTTTSHFLLGKEEKQLLFCIQYEPFIYITQADDTQILMMCDLCQLILGNNIITVRKGYYQLKCDLFIGEVNRLHHDW